MFECGAPESSGGSGRMRAGISGTIPQIHKAFRQVLAVVANYSSIPITQYVVFGPLVLDLLHVTLEIAIPREEGRQVSQLVLLWAGPYNTAKDVPAGFLCFSCKISESRVDVCLPDPGPIYENSVTGISFGPPLPGW